MRKLLIVLFFLLPQFNVQSSTDCPYLPDVTHVTVFAGKSTSREYYSARLNNAPALDQFASWEYAEAWSESWYDEQPFDLDPVYTVFISTDDDDKLEWSAMIYASKTDAWIAYPAFFDWNLDASVGSDGFKHPACWLGMDVRQVWDFIELVKSGMP